MLIGEKLLELRKKKGLSQEEAANILNVSRQTISKWETDQSTPDFDKIVPICELYEISTDELLKGIKTEENIEVTTNKNNSARNIAVSVCLYIISVVFLIGISTLGHPILGLSLMLITIALATGIIVYNGIVNKKPKRKLSKNEKKIKHINEAISIFIVIIYFVVSFTTMAWHITWVLFLVDGLLEEIVKLIYSCKGDENND